MAESGSQRVPSVAAVAVALLLGTTFSEYAQISSAVITSACWMQLVAVIVLCWTTRRCRVRSVSGAITVLIVLLAMLRWNLSSAAFETLPVHQLAQQGTSVVEMDLRVDSVPFEYERPLSTVGSVSHDDSWQTRFIAT